MLGPLLLGDADDNIDTKERAELANSWRALPEHRDESQVQLDVDRSFIYYPHGGSLYSSHLTTELTFAQTNPLKKLINERKNSLI